ncbi:MAG: fused MFS/spermidine synthase [Fimbriimonas ginsengisoli]|uniref:Fused MFS/spermidine synthase n=1 Tax=Fimbriimonas ginsengisoli TaxID=1005039 RepID=A0A931LWK5_FIMGI|nr:fused MFS/spermidine synthase [Fimbriimonas ginsengisoli]
MPRAVLYALFLISGCSALLLEVVWTRSLVLHFGGTTLAVAAVLSSFMTGLALGSAVAGRLAARLRRPLLAYGVLEGLTGIAALLVPAVVAASSPALNALYGGANGPTLGFEVARFVVAFAALVVPTTLMGATLPMIGQYLGADRSRLARNVGLAYAFNTFGAASGAALAGFVLIPAIGMSRTAMLAEAAYLLIGLVAVAYGLRASSLAVEAQEPEASIVPERLIVFGAALAGFTALSLELLWTRIFINSFHSTIQAFSTILVTFLLGLAGGVAIGARLARRATNLSHLAALLALSALLSLLLTWRMISLPTWYVSLWAGTLNASAARIILCVALLTVPVLLMGMTLPLCLHLARNRAGQPGGLVGAVYAANSLGSAVGPLVAAFLLVPFVGAFGAVAAVALLQSAFAMVLLARKGESSAPRGTTALVFAALVLSAVLLGSSKTEFAPRVSPPAFVAQSDAVLRYRESAYGTMMVAQSMRTGEKSLFIDGFLTAGDGPGSSYIRMMGHLPMLAHPHPQSVLVICLGTGITLGSISLHAPSILDCAEINPEVPGCTRLFGEKNHNVLDSPVTRLIIDDGRHYLGRTDRRYDVITLEPMPPDFAGAVNLYSQQFDELVRSRLKPGGVFAQWLPLHLVTVEDSKAIVRAVASTFPNVLVWLMPGESSAIILASDDPLLLPARVGLDAVRNDLAQLHLDSAAALEGEIVLRSAAVQNYAGAARAVTDDLPSLEYSDFEAQVDRVGVTEVVRQNIREMLMSRSLGTH